MPKLPISIDIHTKAIPCTLLSSLIQYAEQNQLNYRRWFKDTQLDLEKIQTSQILVSYDVLHGVLNNAHNDLSHLALGLELSKISGMGSMGLLGFVMQSSKDIAQAFSAGLQYHLISGSVLNLDVQITTDDVILEITERFPSSELHTFFVEEMSASIINCLDILIGRHTYLNKIEFSFPAPLYCSKYEIFFQCLIEYDAKVTRIYFNPTVLTQSIRTANTANYNQAIKICNEELTKLEQYLLPKTTSQIIHYIKKNLPIKTTLKDIASYLNMSERQLRRHLTDENTSFTTLKQQTLKLHAISLLQQRKSVESVSLALGFSEAREFRRAFKQWTNKTPSQFRNGE